MGDPLISIPAVTTAVGVLVAAWQLFRAHRQAVTAFEDSLAREYRELAAELPIEAFLGRNLTDQQYRQSSDKFYHYFDLSNEQVFLYQRKRVRASTWTFWKDGIGSNLRRPAFKRAWREVCERCSDFSELRELFPPERVSEDHAT